MDASRDNFFPGAAFSNNQNGIAMRVGALNRSVNALHRNRDAHEATHGDPETSMAWETHSRVGSSFRVTRSDGSGRSPAVIYHKSIASREASRLGNDADSNFGGSTMAHGDSRTAMPDPCARRVRSQASHAAAIDSERWRRSTTFVPLRAERCEPHPRRRRDRR